MYIYKIIKNNRSEPKQEEKKIWILHPNVNGSQLWFSFKITSQQRNEWTSIDVLENIPEF